MTLSSAADLKAGDVLRLFGYSWTLDSVTGIQTPVVRFSRSGTMRNDMGSFDGILDLDLTLADLKTAITSGLAHLTRSVEVELGVGDVTITDGVVYDSGIVGATSVSSSPDPRRSVEEIRARIEDINREYKELEDGPRDMIVTFSLGHLKNERRHLEWVLNEGEKP